MSSSSSSPTSPHPTQSSSFATRQVPKIIQIQLHLRKGQPLIRCRSTKDLPDPAPWELDLENDTFDTLCAKIRSRTVGFVGLDWPRNGIPYLQPAHTTPQKRYKELTEENFKARFEKAWKLESRRVGKDSEVFLHIYVYLEDPDNHPAAPDNDPAAHVDHSTKQIDATEHADISTTQAISQKRSAEPTEDQEPYKTIRIKLEGVVVPIQVELRSLREALNLPYLG
ncbi:hypothetical protein BGX27_010181 [Mortierella sp. AM989]|nr:hypothetical protein BGX27_010181 [Mortierella sp. AM989]